MNSSLFLIHVTLHEVLMSRTCQELYKLVNRPLFCIDVVVVVVSKSRCLHVAVRWLLIEMLCRYFGQKLVFLIRS